MSNKTCQGLIAKSGPLESPELEINLLTDKTRHNSKDERRQEHEKRHKACQGLVAKPGPLESPDLEINHDTWPICARARKAICETANHLFNMFLRS